MKLLLRLLVIVCLVAPLQLFAAKHITAYINNGTFLSASGPYIETYIHISGHSLVYRLNDNGRFQAAVDILITYTPVKDSLKKDTTHIKYDKYVLHSLELNDTTHIPFDLFDLKRVNLKNNESYTVEVNLIDEAQPKITASLNQAVDVMYDSTAAQLSDITLVDTFKATAAQNMYSKDGYDIQPRTFNFYPTDKSTLNFYVEVYNMQKAVGGNSYIVVYSITKTNADEVVDNLSGVSKQTADVKNFVLASLDITELPSGNYLLHVAVHDKTNKLLTERKLYFQRSNQRAVKNLDNLSLLKVNSTFAQRIPKDSLTFYMQCLLPLAQAYEVQYINDAVKMRDTAIARQFIYNFWYKRNSVDPEKPYKKYMADVYYVEGIFSTRIRHGFETDRGRVYLEYGKPDEREVYDREPSALPYERWQYYYLTNTHQNNVTFIFYNPDLVTNDFTLINSNAIGEIQDDRWQYKIFDAFKNSDGFNNIDNTTVPNTFGTQINNPF